MTPQLPVRVVQPRTDAEGRIRFAADLGVATTIARWVAAGAPVQLRTGAPQGTAADWSGSLRRGAAQVLVVAADGDSEATWCAEQLGAAVVSPARLPDRLTALLPGHVAHQGPGMPYHQGILPAEAAAETGIDAASPGAVHEFAYLGSQPAVRSVPVHNLPLGTEPAQAARRTALVRAAATHQIVPVPVLAPEDLTLPVARTLHASGMARVRLDATPGSADAVRAALVVAGSASLTVAVRLDLTGRTEPPDVLAPWVAHVVRARPDTDVVAGAAQLRALAAHGALAGVLPSSTLARAVREESRRGRAARERLVEGHYPPVPLVSGPHDLWWEHHDQPQQHLDWLGATIPAGGYLHLSAHHDTSGWTAPVPVSDHREITAYGQLGPTDQGALAALATPDCVTAFLTDVEAAWRTGTAPPRLLGTAVAGLCAVGAPCWAAGGRRLYVDRCGTIRCRPGGPALGQVGDSFAQLRRRLRAPGGCRPAREVPAWLPRVLSAREALRALAPTDPDARASGLGQSLLHPLPRGTQWPTGLALVRVGERYLAHHAGQGTTAELSRAQAAAVELSLDLGPDAAPVLSELRGSPVTTRDVHQLVAGLVARLTGTVPDAADLPPRSAPATPQPDLATATQG